MSEETFAVIAPYPDVAQLAQGYVNRADGERLLLPLPRELEPGAIVRFVVHLSDGTPAFAGAGTCVQASDQGDSVAADDRFETLIDSLRFDARSQPVYDYIVAVRASAFGEAPEVETAAAVEEHAASSMYEAHHDQERRAEESRGDDVDAERDAFAPSAFEVRADLHISQTVRPDGAGRGSDAPMNADSRATPVPDGGRRRGSGRPNGSAGDDLATIGREPSFIPPPIPTGLLRRPARTMHWQPAPPRRPTPRPATGLFRYGPAGLPRPARAPRPDLEPAYWVQPAPRPA